MTGVDRRRRWRLEDKLRIVAEAGQPGSRFAEVARRHEVSLSLLWSWRDQVRRGVLVAKPPPVFMPVRVVAEPPAPKPGAPAAPASSHGVDAAAASGRIEIALPDGTVIRVAEEVGLAALRRVVAALRA